MSFTEISTDWSPPKTVQSFLMTCKQLQQVGLPWKKVSMQHHLQAKVQQDLPLCHYWGSTGPVSLYRPRQQTMQGGLGTTAHHTRNRHCPQKNIADVGSENKNEVINLARVICLSLLERLRKSWEKDGWRYKSPFSPLSASSSCNFFCFVCYFFFLTDSPCDSRVWWSNQRMMLRRGKRSR